MSKRSYINFIAGRYFSSRKKVKMISTTSIITIIGTFLGTFAIIASLSVMNGFRDMLFQRTQDMAPDLTFYIKNTDHDERDKLYEDVKKDMRFKIVTPSIERKMLISEGKYQQLAYVKGVQPKEYKKLIHITPYTMNKEFLSDDISKTAFPEIILGMALANRLGAEVGDTVNIISLLDVKSYDAPSMKCIVKDVFNVTVFDYDFRAYIHILDMQYLLDEPNFHQFEADLFSSKDLNEVDKYWKDHLPKNARVATWWEEHLDLFSAMEIEKIATFLVLSLIILIAGFNLISAMIMLLLEKKWEIGILQSMGCAPGDAYKIYFRLGWYTGGIGMALGVLSAVVLLLIQQYMPFIVMPGANDVYIFKYVPVIVNVWDVLITVAMVSILITLSSLIPARRANKIKPLDAIKTKQ